MNARSNATSNMGASLCDVEREVVVGVVGVGVQPRGSAGLVRRHEDEVQYVAASSWPGGASLDACGDQVGTSEVW